LSGCINEIGNKRFLIFANIFYDRSRLSRHHIMQFNFSSEIDHHHWIFVTKHKVAYIVALYLGM